MQQDFILGAEGTPLTPERQSTVVPTRGARLKISGGMSHDFPPKDNVITEE
jgi:hypothetical protein